MMPAKIWTTMKCLLFFLSVIAIGYAAGDEIIITDLTLRSITDIDYNKKIWIGKPNDLRPGAVILAQNRGIEESAFALALLDFSEEEFKRGHVEHARQAISFAVQIPTTNTIPRLQILATKDTLKDIRGAYLHALVWKSPLYSLPFIQRNWPTLEPEEKQDLVGIIKDKITWDNSQDLEAWKDYLRELIDNEPDMGIVDGIKDCLATEPMREMN